MGYWKHLFQLAGHLLPPVFSKSTPWIGIVCYGATQLHWQFQAAAARPQDLELLCSSQLLMMGVFEGDGASCQFPPGGGVLCRGSNASLSGKYVENRGCCQITDPSVSQHNFLLLPVTETSSSTPWRALLFAPINLLAPHFPKSLTQSHQEGACHRFRPEVWLQVQERPMLHTYRRDIKLSQIKECTSATLFQPHPNLVWWVCRDLLRLRRWEVRPSEIWKEWRGKMLITLKEKCLLWRQVMLKMKLILCNMSGC